MKVSKLPVDTGLSGWEASAPAPAPAIALQSEIEADFLVVGAGFAGLAAARRLTQLAPDSRIVLLDAKRVGEGPAGRNSGFMIDLPHELSSSDYAGALDRDRNQIRLNRMAIGFAREMVQEFSLPAHTFDERGKVNGAVDGAAVQNNIDYARHLERLDEPCSLLDEHQMRDLTGSGFYASGLYSPGTVLLQPVLYTRGVAAGMGNTISLFENSPVISLDQTAGGWIARTPGGAVRAAKAILATNGHIESFGHFKRQVFHLILFASMSRALSGDEAAAFGEANWGITPSDPAATTMRKFTGPDGARIITRNQMQYAPGLETTDAVLAKMAIRHQRSFLARYPAFGCVEQEYSWAGRLCLSRNSAPAFGEIGDGLFSACCQNGLGTTRGTLAGMAAAEFAASGRTKLVEDLLEQGTPTPLPPAPLDRIGANAYLRLAEFKARREM